MARSQFLLQTRQHGSLFLLKEVEAFSLKKDTLHFLFNLHGGHRNLGDELRLLSVLGHLHIDDTLVMVDAHDHPFAGSQHETVFFLQCDRRLKLADAHTIMKDLIIERGGKHHV